MKRLSLWVIVSGLSLIVAVPGSGRGEPNEAAAAQESAPAVEASASTLPPGGEPTLPSSTTQGEPATATEGGGIQERGILDQLKEGATKNLGQLPASPPSRWKYPPGILPGEVAFRTWKSFFLTARNGGQQSVDAVISSATTAGPNEKFKLSQLHPGFWLIQTQLGYYLSADGGHGAGSESATFYSGHTAFGQSDSTLFRIARWISATADIITIRTYSAHFLNAVDGGGKTTAAFRTDTKKPKNEGIFYVVKCGDLGSAFAYNLRPAVVKKSSSSTPDLTPILKATGGGGRTTKAIGFGFTNAAEWDWARFLLLRQPDGSYALMTSNSRNYVTAEGGGGIAHSNQNNLQTNRTQVQAWEKFRIVDQGDCTYTIQTSGGWYLAWQLVGGNISTRISFPNEAPSIGYNAKWEFLLANFAPLEVGG